MSRPMVSRSDFILRLFIDTNVLIDYLEDFDKRYAKTFIEIFKSSDFENIEMVTSDYVCWELYGYLRKDMYAKKMINDKNWGFSRARKGMNNFKGIDIDEMINIGSTIDNMVNELTNNEGINVITIEKIMSQETINFSETVEIFIKNSKFSYKDVMVLVSAIYAHSHIIVTMDDPFKTEGNQRISDLEEEKRELPIQFSLSFKKPSDFSSEEIINKNYKDWFEDYNSQNKIGSIIQCWTDKNIIAVKCVDECTLKENDYIYIVKFSENNKFIKKLCKIEKDNMKDYDSENQISEGEKVTIKLLDNFLSSSNFENASIYLSAE